MGRNVVAKLVDVASHYGVSPETVRDWRRKGMPGQRGQWDLDAIDRWRSTLMSSKDRTGKHDITASRNEIGPANDHIADKATKAKLRAIEADAEKKEADARIKQMQLRKLENANIVDLVDVENFLSQLFSDVRKMFLKIPPMVRKRYGTEAGTFVEQQIKLKLHGAKKLSERLVDLRDE